MSAVVVRNPWGWHKAKLTVMFSGPLPISFPLTATEFEKHLQQVRRLPSFYSEKY